MILPENYAAISWMDFFVDASKNSSWFSSVFESKWNPIHIELVNKQPNLFWRVFSQNSSLKKDLRNELNLRKRISDKIFVIYVSQSYCVVWKMNVAICFLVMWKNGTIKFSGPYCDSINEWLIIIHSDSEDGLDIALYFLLLLR